MWRKKFCCENGGGFAALLYVKRARKSHQINFEVAHYREEEERPTLWNLAQGRREKVWGSGMEVWLSWETYAGVMTVESACGSCGRCQGSSQLNEWMKLFQSIDLSNVIKPHPLCDICPLILLASRWQCKNAIPLYCSLNTCVEVLWILAVERQSYHSQVSLAQGQGHKS